MLTAGVDLAAQPNKTGAVVVDWSAEPPAVVHAATKVTDEQVLALCREVAVQQGRVGIDCPLGWPRAFLAFIAAHAADVPLPIMGSDTRSLRLRTTDIALHERLGLNPLSVSTNMLGVTALRAARLLAALRECGMPVDRAGRGMVCEVYPAASRVAWGLPTKARDLTGLLTQLSLTVPPAERAQLENEHAFDALIAALTARAVALGATDFPAAEHEDLAAEEGWIHVPLFGHRLVGLTAR
jgi:predicted nuclease with RNAse H fold